MQVKLVNERILSFELLLLPVGSGPIPEVLQYRANPWRWRSKPLSHRPVPKISLISKRCMHRVSDIKLIRTDTFFEGDGHATPKEIDKEL